MITVLVQPFGKRLEIKKLPSLARCKGQEIQIPAVPPYLADELPTQHALSQAQHAGPVTGSNRYGLLKKVACTLSFGILSKATLSIPLSAGLSAGAGSL